MMLSTNQQSNTKDLSEQSRKVLAIRDKVFAEWEERVRSLISGADEVNHPVLLDTLPLFYPQRPTLGIGQHQAFHGLFESESRIMPWKPHEHWIL
jgi:hypothetical protein